MQWQITDSLVAQECISCGITFAMTATVIAQLRESRREFLCPNGHAHSYTAANDHERKVKSLEERIVWLETEAQRRDAILAEVRASRDALERSNAALRGAVTRLKGRK